MMNRLKIEFIGTFFLVLVVALTGSPLAIGAVLVALVYMGGYISGGHFNPAVTVSLMLSGKIKSGEAYKYIAAQLAAGIVAALIFNIIKADKFIPSVPAGSDLAAAFIIEVIFTFLLCFVILHVAATDKTKDNNYYGLAIGFTLMVAAFAGGPISGGAFNPAVGVSPLLFDYSTISTNLTTISIYTLGPVVGGILAALTYKSMDDKKNLFPW